MGQSSANDPEESWKYELGLRGAVKVRHELPYMPKNQFSLSVGLTGEPWQIYLNYQYTDAMLESAGDKTPLSDFKV